MAILQTVERVSSTFGSVSHVMSALATNLDNRRRQLGLTLADVHADLSLKGVQVSPSTVGHWFTGERRPRQMEHLKALCEVLQTSISQMAGEDPEFAQDAFESVLLKEGRSLSVAQREAVLAMLHAMKALQ